jgi:hypothetical protein
MMGISVYGLLNEGCSYSNPDQFCMTLLESALIEIYMILLTLVEFKTGRMYKDMGNDYERLSRTPI